MRTETWEARVERLESSVHHLEARLVVMTERQRRSDGKLRRWRGVSVLLAVLGLCLLPLPAGRAAATISFETLRAFLQHLRVEGDFIILDHANFQDNSSGLVGLDIHNDGDGMAIRGHSKRSLGVAGESEQQVGVYGYSINHNGTVGDSENASGVRGFSKSNQGHAGVWGVNQKAGIGVHGESNDSASVGAPADQSYGVLGESQIGTGVSGVSSGNRARSFGVWGSGDNGRGVVGTSANGVGVYGYSRRGIGGEFHSEGWDAVHAETTSPNSAIYGKAPAAGYAGFFEGRVAIRGWLEKPAGSFKIDHPLQPARKYLYHSFVESPDMKNIYDGVVVLVLQRRDSPIS